MTVHAHRNENESNDGLQQRFKKQVQRTGVLKMLRKKSVHRRSDSKRMTRQKALKREEYREQNRKKQFYSNM